MSGHRRGTLSAVISVLALVFSGYSLRDSSLKAPDLKVFVPPVIQFSAPYNNSSFEVIEVPVTLLNDGGRRSRRRANLPAVVGACPFKVSIRSTNASRSWTLHALATPRR
jgi:hypothetical protein